METLIWLALGLLLTAAIGHALWVAGAAILRAIFGRFQVNRLTPSDLSAVARYYRTLLADGAIDAAEYTRLHNLLDIEFRRRHLLPPARAVEVAPGSARERVLAATARSSSAASTSPQAAVRETGPAIEEVLSGRPVNVPSPAALSGREPDLPPILATAVDNDEDVGAVKDGTRTKVVGAVRAGAPHRTGSTEPPPARSPFDFDEAPPRPPRRAWSEVLQSFMQEKNIRWGELISGILIIGSAVGLVISLRQELQRTIPYFPALLFMGITAAIHGAGLYSLKKWKLETTSRGTLTIGLLLVPLNLFAACMMSRAGAERALTDPVLLGALVLGLAGFGAMTFAGSRPLFRPANGWLVALGILGCAFWQIVLHRGLDEHSSFLFTNLLSVPLVLGFATANGVFATRQPLAPVAGEKPAALVEQQLLAVGLTLFALLCALGMAMLSVGHVGRALDRLSPVVLPLAALGFLLPGGRLMRMTGTRWGSVAGLALIVFAASIGALAFVWSWPAPGAMATAAAMGALVVGGAAYVTRAAGFTAAAAVGLIVAALLALHLATGTYDSGPGTWLAQHGRALISITTSVGLAVLGGLVLGLPRAVSAAGVQLGSRHVRALSAVGVGASIASAAVALIASAAGATGTNLTTASAILLWQALAALLAGGLAGQKLLHRVGHALLFIALLHISHYHAAEWSWFGRDDRKLSFITWALAGHILVAGPVAIAAKLAMRSRSALSAARWALVAREFAGAALLLAGPLALLALATDLWRPTQLAAEASILALAMSAGFLAFHLPIYFSLLQVALYLAALAAASSLASAWGYRWHWTAPQFVAFELTVAAVVGTLWNAAELAASRFPKSPSIFLRYRADVAVSSALSVLMFLLALVSCVPGMLEEFGWRSLDTIPAAGEAWLVDLQHTQVLWAPWIALVGCLAAGQLGRAATLYREGLVISLFGILLTYASRFAPYAATASAARWLLAHGLLGIGLVSIVAWHLLARLWPAPGEEHREPSGSRRHPYVWSSIVCSLTPLVALMILALLRGVSGGAFGGPSRAIWLGTIGAEANYGLPLLIALVALQTIAWDRRELVFARAGAVILLLLVFTWVAAVQFAPYGFDRAAFVTRYCHLSAFVLALYGSGWLLLERRLTDSGDAIKLLRRTYLGVMVTASAAPALAALALLLIDSSTSTRMIVALNQPLAWLAAAAAFAFGGAALRGSASWQRSLLAASAGAVLTGLVVARLQAAWQPFDWPALRAALAGMLAIASTACCMPLMRLRRKLQLPEADEQPLRQVRRVIAASALLLTGVALVRVANADPQALRWFLGGTALALIAATLAQWTLARWFSYAGTAVVILGCIMVIYLYRPTRQWHPGALLVHSNVVLCCAYGMICVVMEKAAARYPLRPVATHRSSAAHRVMPRVLVWGGAVLVTAATLLRLWSGRDIAWTDAVLIHPYGIASLLMLGALVLVTLADTSYQHRLILVYIWGLTSTVFGIALFTHGATHYAATLYACLGLALASFAAVAAYLWRYQVALWVLARRLGLVKSGDVAAPTERWFVASELAIVVLTTLAQLAMVLNGELRGLRIAAALTPLLGAVAVASLSSVARSIRQQGQLALATLLLFGLFCVYASWADIAPRDALAIWLPRLLRLAVVGALLTFVCGTLVPRLVKVGTVWNLALWRMTVIAAGTAISSLLVLLGVELQMYLRYGAVTLSAVETTMVAIMFLVMLVGFVAMALRPAGAEAGLTLRRRQACIYVAEAIGALLALHVGVAMPWLLLPEWRPYWPYSVMLLAFAGAGASEVFRRRKLEVLAEPVLRTTLLLPLVPLVLMGFLHTQADTAMILFLAGLLYLAFGITRSSPWYMLAAAGCGNLALWNLIGRSEALDFTRHPQLWLIPPALSVLAATHSYANRLTKAQRSISSYACALVIYVSSTAEVFLQGIGTQLWPPMVLIMLAVAGVLLGIVLQVRAFLILGTSFVFVSMFSMVMHAQRVLHHVWPWWAFGIGLGIAILVFFALFEKKRAEMLEIARRVRQWE